MSSLGVEKIWALPSLRGFTFPSSGIAHFATGGIMYSIRNHVVLCFSVNDGNVLLTDS